MYPNVLYIFNYFKSTVYENHAQFLAEEYFMP